MRLKGFRESLQEIAISGRAPAAAAPHQKKSFSLLIDKDSWTFPTFAHFVWQNLCIWQLCKVINLTTNLTSWLRNLPPTTDHLGAAVRLPWNFDEFPTSAVRSRKKGKREKKRETEREWALVKARKLRREVGRPFRTDIAPPSNFWNTGLFLPPPFEREYLRVCIPMPPTTERPLPP